LKTSLEWSLPLNVLKEVSSNETGTIGRYDDYMDFLSKNLADDEPQETPAPRVSPAPVLEPGAPSDLELMQGIQQADPEALSLLYDRYNGILKALILRVIHNEAEADDLLQEIFMEIWNQAKNFSPRRGNRSAGW
jgi:hypothetical protein